MSGPEVLHRLGGALRDTLATPAWSRLAPSAAAARLLTDARREAASSEVWARVAHLPPAGECAGTIEAARRLSSGSWRLFGRDVTLADPPRWSENPLTGQSWPDLPSREIDYRRQDLAGGAKLTWEAGRLTMLPTLALAARLEGDPRHAERARRWLDDFTRLNPIGRGIHHTSGIEMAIRTFTIGWTLALIGEPGDATPARGLMAQQALWCRDHLSLGSSANNHLLAEYAAMVVAGAGLGALADGERVMAEGLEGLLHELPRQIHADGVTAEQAFRYLPFVWELVLPALCLAGARGWQAPAPARDRLRSSLEFARTLRRADGTLPPIGDEDDARILLADESGTRLDLAGNALAAWLGAPGLSDQAQALAILLTGSRADETRAAADGERHFDLGGCSVWRSGAAIATFDHGPLGLGSLAAHGHADALSLTLRHGDDDLFGDPGTLAYHEDEGARTLTRSTPAHSTVHFGGRSQSEMLGAFLWGRRARVSRADEGWRCDWWSGESHVRRVRFEAGELSVEDEAIGPAPELVFALPPGAEVRLDGIRATVLSGSSSARFELEAGEAWRVEPGTWAARFTQVEPAPRLVASIPDTRARTTVRFGTR